MKQKQLSMFSQGQDLPLFSNTPQRVAVEAFEPVAEAQQATWAKCSACKDTGKIGSRFCTCEAGQAAWQAQRRDRIVQDAAAVSSGTLAGLIGDNRYSVVEQVQGEFVEWCLALGADTECRTWQDAWERFWAQREG